MKIGFIGAGKVGTAFGKFLINKGINVIGYNSRNDESMRKATEYTQTKNYSKKDLVKEADVIFITVNDDNIQNVLEDSISSFKRLDNKTFIHMSGAHSSRLLIKAFNKGADVYSLHPLQSVSVIEKAVKDFDNTYFSVETIGEINENMREILTSIKNHFKIESSQKAIYHMAACVFSNYLATLMDFGLELTSSIGIDEDKAFKAMLPLINGTLKNIEIKGIKNSLTGPLARGDVDTIKKHLKSYERLNKDYEVFYRFLGLKTLNYAEKNNMLKADKFQLMKNILEGNHEKDNY